MKKLLLLTFCAAILLTAAATAQNAAKPGAKQVTLLCKIIDAPANAESIGLFEPLGMAYREVARGARQADGSYIVTIPASEPKMYAIGFNESQIGPIILGSEKEVTLWANAQFMEKGRTIGSELNKAFETARNQAAALRETGDQLRNDLRMARSTRNGQSIKAEQEKIAAHQREKAQLLDELKKSNPLIWRSISLLLSPDDKGDSNAGELDFYGENFFGYAKLDDPAYEETPEVFQAFQNYVQTISQLGANAVNSKALIDAQLAKLKPGSKMHRRAFAGVVDGMQKANHPEYVNYAQQYIKLYKKEDLGEVGRLEYDLRKFATYTVGMEAPDLVGNT
ncbi:MAG: hypothetical protein JNK89_04490, partial [Saprospiraceae bacterium]|nr:hypothetical protein [Saprospiraceae bacterium]